jgi:hypothetical protein
MSWLSVTAGKSKIQSNTTIELTLTALTTNGKQSGVMFFRLPDGFSVPVTVVAETGEYQYPQNTVTTEADDGAGSLRQVVRDSYNNDEILIPGHFIIRLDSAVVFDKTLKIKGQGATVQVRNPGVSTHRVFSIGSPTKPSTPETVVIDHLTILGGDVSGQSASGGAVFVDQSKSITLRNCTIANGKAATGGGLMTTHPSPRSVLLEDCVFENNTATSQSGACYLAGSGKVVVNNVAFINNRSAGSASALASKCIATTVSGCYFKDNTADPGNRNGAALCYSFDNDKGSMMVENTTFEGNVNSFSEGGAAFFGNESSTSGTIFTNCTFYNNRSSHGAVYDYNGSVAAINCTFAGNTASNANYGSAFYARDNAAVKLTLVNNIIAFNYGGKAALYAGSKSVDSGSHNLIESYTGKSALALQQSLPYDTNRELFSDYTTINGLRAPQIDNATHTLPVTPTGVAAGAGIAGFTGFTVPESDQRGKQRGNPPYIGSFEYVAGATATGPATGEKTGFIAVNPASGRLQIHDSESLRSNSITNMAGKVCYTAAYRQTDIPLPHIPAGYYIVRFETEQGVFYEKLIMK